MSTTTTTDLETPVKPTAKTLDMIGKHLLTVLEAMSSKVPPAHYAAAIEEWKATVKAGLSKPDHSDNRTTSAA